MRAGGVGDLGDRVGGAVPVEQDAVRQPYGTDARRREVEQDAQQDERAAHRSHGCQMPLRLRRAELR